jgi:hypothetical protein
MSHARERRNGGRLLGVVIESGDVRSRKALQALSAVTRETFGARGLDISAWPADVLELLGGVGSISRFVRTDTHGEQHVFALADCGEFDLLVGVSSRREVNVPGLRSGNLATNVLLEVLALPDPSDATRPRYGQLGAEDLNRVWRSDVGVAHVQAWARDWDLVLWSRSDYLDYLVPGTAFMGTMRGNQAAEQATSVVVNGSKHKAAAHRDGKLKYARGQTHPLIRVHAVTRQILGYDEDVVDAIRDAVRLLRGGASWDEAALAVGSRIPATQAQQEPDEDHDGAHTRTRSARNALRAAQDLPELPLRFLPDGSPNPDYRPESILDLNRPGERLKTLLVWGPSVSARDAASIAGRVDADLDGVAPDDSFHELYASGTYRRLVKDQTLSNSAVVRYGWVALELGPTADGSFVLTADDILFLRKFRTGRTGTGSWGNNPLTGVFRVEQPTPLYTRSGWLDPANGTFRARSGSTDGTRGLRIWFEPPGATPHSAKCRALGWIPNAEIGPAVAQMLIEAVTEDHQLAEFRFDHPALRDDPAAAPKKTVADLERRHEATAICLADPDLTAMTIAALKRELTAVEQQLAHARSALEVAEATARSAPSTHDDEFDISDLAQLAAILQAAVPVPPRVAERAARLLRTMLHDPRLILEPRTAQVQIAATLVLHSEQGQISIPVRGHVANRSSDPWVAGVAGMWWEQRTVPFVCLMAEHGLASNSGTRWHEPVVQRLLAEATNRGRPLRGPNLAALLVRCDDPASLARIRAAIDTGGGAEDPCPLLFDGPDIRRGTPWKSVAGTLLSTVDPDETS